MAIPVERPKLEVREQRLPLYGARAAAIAGYTAAVLTGVALVGPVLGADAPATVSLSAPDAQVVEAEGGATLSSLAAENGVSVARLLALNPALGPLGPAEGQTIRVR
jgi:LysM repeat protein